MRFNNYYDEELILDRVKRRNHRAPQVNFGIIHGPAYRIVCTDMTAYRLKPPFWIL